MPCPEGCTLTQGHWRTHNDSFQGGAPSDETWLLVLPDAEQTTFFLSGQSYFDVMWTSSRGNAYYILAVQYIAAELSMLDNADGSSVQDAFDDATALFEAWTPAQVGTWKGNNPNRQEFLSLAGTLAGFNEGDVGPGHCDEGSDEATTVTGRSVPSVAYGALVAVLLPVAWRRVRRVR